jgi:hypothetical protein
MKPAKRSLTIERARAVLNYDPSTGDLTWRVTSARGMKPGDVAGTVNTLGYRVVSVGEERISAHRLVWFMHYGEWPEHNVTPKNGDKLDLRIDNLAMKTAAEMSRSRSGRGVSAHKGRWRAEITRNYKKMYLGSFATEAEAVAVYQKALTLEDPSVLSPKGKQYDIKSRRHYNLLRSAWQRTTRENGSVVEWTTFDDFATDLQDHVFPYCRVVPRNPELPIGPTNFVVEKMAKFDRSTPEGRDAYYKYKNRMRKGAIKNHNLIRAFGISKVTYDAMMEKQNGVCAICGGVETHKYKGEVRGLSVDHCHTTGKVRALLCHSCNHGLGNFKDRSAVLRKAAEYVDHHAAQHAAEPNASQPHHPAYAFQKSKDREKER